jgi:hypothetical protein
MTIEAHADAPNGAVVAVLRKGYQQRGRVLRYAEVAVNRVPEVAPDDLAESPRPELQEERLQVNPISESEEQ